MWCLNSSAVWVFCPAFHSVMHLQSKICAVFVTHKLYSCSQIIALFSGAKQAIQTITNFYVVLSEVFHRVEKNKPII